MMDFEPIQPSYLDYNERAFMVGVLGNLQLLKKMSDLGYDVLKVDSYNPENTVSSYYYENRLFSEKVYEVIAGPKGSYKIHLDEDYNSTIILELPIVKQYHNLLKRLGKKHLSKIDHFLPKFKYNIGYVDLMDPFECEGQIQIKEIKDGLVISRNYDGSFGLMVIEELNHIVDLLEIYKTGITEVKEAIRRKEFYASRDTFSNGARGRAGTALSEIEYLTGCGQR